MAKFDTHNTGNIGLHFVCYRLARLGWNVMPTARNARGVDILASKVHAITIQVKTLSGIDPVNIKDDDKYPAAFLIVVMNARVEAPSWPECYVLTMAAAKKIVVRHATRPWIPVQKLKPHRDKWDVLDGGSD
jgi:hypothetical protein